MGLSAWYNQSPEEMKNWFFHPKISCAQFLQQFQTKTTAPSTFQFMSSKYIDAA
jgi:hypothetical protein